MGKGPASRYGTAREADAGIFTNSPAWVYRVIVSALERGDETGQ